MTCSSSSARYSSRLPGKCWYSTGLLTPARSAMSSIAAAWKPWATKTSCAARSNCSRRAPRGRRDVRRLGAAAGRGVCMAPSMLPAGSVGRAAAQPTGLPSDGDARRVPPFRRPRRARRAAGRLPSSDARCRGCAACCRPGRAGRSPMRGGEVFVRHTPWTGSGRRRRSAPRASARSTCTAWVARPPTGPTWPRCSPSASTGGHWTCRASGGRSRRRAGTTRSAGTARRSSTCSSTCVDLPGARAAVSRCTCSATPSAAWSACWSPLAVPTWWRR